MSGTVASTRQRFSWAPCMGQKGHDVCLSRTRLRVPVARQVGRVGLQPLLTAQ